jgi:hypothetical protein
VLSVLGIIFGSIGVVCTPLALVPLLMAEQLDAAEWQAVKQNQALYAYTVISALAGLLLALVLLCGSIGGLLLKPWARSLLLGYAGVALVVGITTLVANLIWVVPAQLAMSTGAADPMVQRAGHIGGMVGSVLGFLFAAVLPCCILYFYTRPHVIAAFGESALAPGAMQQRYR